MGKHLLSTAPEQPKQAKKTPPPKVEVIILAPQQYQVRLKTSGRISAAVTSIISAEVKGRITLVNPQFHIGGQIKKGDVLIEVDDTDYQQSLTIALAELAQAQLAIEQGNAERDQVLRDRAILGLSDKPSKLALREPQRKSDQAALDAAKARVAQARTQLTRTKTTAPFDGQLTKTMVNLGQYVTPGTPVAEVIGTEKLEVRLPLNDSQLAFVGETTLSDNPLPVTLKADQKTWHARLVRQEGVVDAQSLQQTVVAEIIQTANAPPPPTLGLFVTAEIEAQLLKEVLVIPRSAVRNNNEVQLITKDNKLFNKKLSSVWVDKENFIIANNALTSKTLVKQPISLAADGIAVEVTNAPSQ